VATATYGVDYDNLIHNTRRTGFEGLFDEARVNWVRIDILSHCPSNVGGFHGVYLERETGEAIVGDYNAIPRQQETSYGDLKEDLVLYWRPKEPTDREFQPLSNWVSVCTIHYLTGPAYLGATTAQYLPDDFELAQIIFTSSITFRGRPD
jgi:hypothetical protein